MRASSDDHRYAQASSCSCESLGRIGSERPQAAYYKKRCSCDSFCRPFRGFSCWDVRDHGFHSPDGSLHPWLYTFAPSGARSQFEMAPTKHQARGFRNGYMPSPSKGLRHRCRWLGATRGRAALPEANAHHRSGQRLQWIPAARSPTADSDRADTSVAGPGRWFRR